MREENVNSILERNKDLAVRFLQIAERKVSILDEYGAENWRALAIEVVECLKRIAQREGRNIDWRQTQRNLKRTDGDYLAYDIPDEYKALASKLERAFHKYHNIQLTKYSDNKSYDSFSGIEFETWIARLLKK